MSKEIPAPRISSDESPRDVLAADFKSIGTLPIRGGWGYTLEGAVIIDKNDPIVPEGVPFDGVGLEYIFAEKRIYEELIVFRPKHARYSGIQWKMTKQRLIHKDNKSFDVLTLEVTALPDKDWEELKAEWEAPTGFGSAGFDAEAHAKKRDSRTIRYVTEYWFDITSFYSG